jgi:hypothetical protein
MMGMGMQTGTPPTSSVLADVLQVLEVVSDPVKAKAYVEQISRLLEESMKMQDIAAQGMKELVGKEAHLAVELQKVEAFKHDKEAFELEKKAFGDRYREVSDKEQALAKKEQAHQAQVLADAEELKTREIALAAKEKEASELKAKAEALMEENKIKSEKLRAIFV